VNCPFDNTNGLTDVHFTLEEHLLSANPECTITPGSEIQYEIEQTAIGPWVEIDPELGGTVPGIREGPGSLNIKLTSHANQCPLDPSSTFTLTGIATTE